MQVSNTSRNQFFSRNGTKLVCEIDKCLQLEREGMVPHRETPLCKKVWIAQIAVLEKLQIENDLQRPNGVEWILHHTLLEKSYDDENGLWMVKIFIFTITFFIHFIKAQWFKNGILKKQKKM